MGLFKRKKAAPPVREPVPAPAPRPVPEERTVEPAAPAPPQEPPKRRLSYRVANLQGVGNRQRQEDSFTFVNAMDVTEIRRKGLLAVVADGMGGMRDGRLASETAIASLKADFQAMDRSRDLGPQLRDGILSASGKVFAALGGDGGSTVVTCVFYEEELYFASVGDSFGFLFREGQLLQLNREHNVRTEDYLEILRSGSVDPERAREDPEGPALTGFLGMENLREVDEFLKPMRLHDGDLILLCSDGVAGVLSEDILKSCLGKRTPEEMCIALEEAVKSENRRYQDNYTALIIQCGL